MTEHKYTDDEIIKALKCISGEEEVFCRECVYSKEGGGFACKKNAARDSLSIITRQKEDIEGYKHLEVILNTAVDKLAQSIKADVIKEFADKLKEKSSSTVAVYNGVEIPETRTYQISAPSLDDLVKEFTEEKK